MEDTNLLDKGAAWLLLGASATAVANVLWAAAYGLPTSAVGVLMSILLTLLSIGIKLTTISFRLDQLIVNTTKKKPEAEGSKEAG